MLEISKEESQLMKEAHRRHLQELRAQAKQYRDSAEYYERVADLAYEDGDKFHAKEAERSAAEARQKAREIEARKEFNAP